MPSDDTLDRAGPGDSIELIGLNNGLANAIDDTLLGIVHERLDSAEKNNKSAVVITGYDRFFSSGLNLRTLPDDYAGMERFIRRFEETVLRLWTLPLPVVAAVNGHAIAGGCILACCADRRIGADSEYRIGVSEVSLGIVFPAIAFEIMRACLNESVRSRVLLAGHLMQPEEAHRAGVLHRLVPSEDLSERSLEEASQLASQPRQAFAHTKLALREPATRKARENQERSRELFLQTWFSDDVVERRHRLLDAKS